jgi:hypothetical protein
MNDETKRWESYVDDAGRRHWRWPAAPVQSTRDGDARRGTLRVAEESQQIKRLPLRVRSR